jgi:hypothetical protein
MATIVYAIHESIGHLGIFVSGSVAMKEHDQFASNIDLIDVLPPGLYEAVMTPKRPDDGDADLIGGDSLVHFEARTLDDIRLLGGNNEEDEKRFATAARVSEINLGLYRTLFQPWVRGFANEGYAEWMRRLHPQRFQLERNHRPTCTCGRSMHGWGSSTNIVVQSRMRMSFGRLSNDIRTGWRHRSTPIAMCGTTLSKPTSIRSTGRLSSKRWSA